MAFPDTPLNPLFELLVDGAWIPVPTYERGGIVVEHGRPDMGSQTDPGSLQVVINNRDGRFSPRNPESDLFGKIGRNTRGRLSVPGTVSYLELDGNPANYASTPDHASLDITGDLDLRWEGEASWYDSDGHILIGKWGAAGIRSYHLRLQDGSLYLHVATDGILGNVASWELPALPKRAALRGTVDVNNGAGGHTFRLYWAESIAGPWTQIGEDVSGSGTLTITSASSPLTIAPEQLDVAIPRRAMAGRVYKAEVRNGIDGTIVAAPDFTAQPAGTTAFADSAGRTWTLSGAAVIRDREDLIVAEVPEWPQSWRPDGSDAWVSIEGAGILRRMGQGKKALQSTLRRRLPSGNPVAYWPLEEGRTATQFYSPITGVRPLRTSGMTMAAEDSLAGSSALPTIRDGSLISGTVPAPSGSPTQWHTEFIFNVPNSGPATARTVLQWLGTGTVKRWRLMLTTNGSQVLGYDADDAVVTSSLLDLTGLGVFNTWCRWQLFAVQNGANVDWSLRFVPIGGAGTGLVTTSYAGTVGRISGLKGPDGGHSGDLDGTALGHLAVFTTAPTFIYNSADIGFTGESADQRMRRLATEENLPLARILGTETTELVGPQTPDTLLTLLQAAADADGGLLLEDRTRPGLLYRDRSSMYSQEPKLTLSYSGAPGLAAPLEPVDDDTATRNDRTVVRDGGSEGRAFLEEGPLSVLDPPDGIGQYDDAVTLSLHDDAQTEPIAYWRLHQGTFDGPRYPTVKVLLHKAPNLIPQVLALTEGDLIRITGLPKYVGFGDVDLIVEGIRHEAGLQRWEVTFNCSPGQPWQVGAIEDALYGRADTAGSQLAAPVDSDDTILTVTTTADLPWITANPALNSNWDFETNLTGWNGSGGTIARVATPQPAPFTGDWSLLFTPNGIAEFPNAGSTTMPVVVGQQYVASGWLRSATARGVALNINWFAAAGAYLSTTSNDVTIPANTWTWFELTATAPATALTANLAATVPDFPPATDLLWGDHITLRQAGGSPSDFPMDIRAGGEVMTVNAITPAVADTFNRTVASGWGTADTGQAWTVVGTAADYSVGSGYAAANQPATGIAHLALAPAPTADVDLVVDVASSVLAAGASLFAGPIVRAVDNNNHYAARLDFNTSAGVVMTLRKRVTGTETQLGTYTSGLTHTAGAFYRVRFQVIGSALKARIWLPAAQEPSAWHLEVTDTALTAAANVGIRCFANTGSTPVNPQLRFDNLQIINPQRFTVVRSRNSVVKSHTTATDVRLADPTTVAL
ncbi:hypothetical protein [Streptomyces sp. NPDC058678]|uniref:hypothetical protein n=1 Tax=Streptomyces sp. NPDC058678 TaxID=3346595 RepID=UPI0036521934